MPEIARLLREKGLEKVLDLGCGTGRHVVYLSRGGFSVYGLDRSSRAIELATEWLAQEALQAELLVQEMTARFPYTDCFFDAIISTQVIHHADMATIRQIVSEMERVLVEGGLVFCTVPSLQNQGRYFRQIEPNTYVPLDGEERGLPHHYFTPQELREVFSGFEVADIHLDQMSHYCLTAYKR
jgi:SAM-dependent methyltransferase